MNKGDSVLAHDLTMFLLETFSVTLREAVYVAPDHS